MSPEAWLPVALILGYLLGSIPFGLLITNAAGLGDVRKIGSGSIGATNVLRTGRKGLAAATVLLDGGKGAVAVLIGHLILPGFGGAICGVMAFIGHCYPVWLRFRGGKGVATMFGVTLALSWMVALVFAIVWLGLLAVTRISSLAGMSAPIAATITAYALGGVDPALPFAGMALIVLWRHRPNIARLLRGEEPRVGSSKTA